MRFVANTAQYSRGQSPQHRHPLQWFFCAVLRKNLVGGFLPCVAIFPCAPRNLCKRAFEPPSLTTLTRPCFAQSPNPTCFRFLCLFTNKLSRCIFSGGDVPEGRKYSDADHWRSWRRRWKLDAVLLMRKASDTQCNCRCVGNGWIDFEFQDQPVLAPSRCPSCSWWKSASKYMTRRPRTPSRVTLSELVNCVSAASGCFYGLARFHAPFSCFRSGQALGSEVTSRWRFRRNFTDCFCDECDAQLVWLTFVQACSQVLRFRGKNTFLGGKNFVFIIRLSQFF